MKIATTFCKLLFITSCAAGVCDATQEVILF